MFLWKKYKSKKKNYFLINIFSAFAFLKNEEEALEELRRHEERINNFKEGMIDEMYRLKLRRDQKCANMKVADSIPNSNYIF